MSDRVKGKVAPENSLDWKCDWMDCLHGCGLAGNGRCSADGEWNNMSCGKFTKIPKHLYDKPQPEPMPLKVGDVIQPRSFVFPEKALAKHDQQVRKDFAEECIKILSEETSKIRVRIRAMAEKE